MGQVVATPIGGATRRAEVKLEAFLSPTISAFRDAARNTGGALNIVHFKVGNHLLQVEAIGNEISQICCNAFGGICCNSPSLETPDFVAHIWDRSVSGVGMPGIPIAPNQRDILGPGLMSQYESGQLLRYDRADLVKTYVRHSAELFMCVEDAGNLGLNDRTKPFPHMLATFLQDQGIQMLHAGAVSLDGKGLLLGGTGGSGKSTTAVACAVAGFSFLGDDTVAVGAQQDGSAVMAHACYNAVRCGPKALEWFPAIARGSFAPINAADKGKHLTFLSDIYPDRCEAKAPIRAVVVAQISGEGRSKLSTISSGKALMRLAPSTLLRGLGGGASGLEAMAKITRSVPCFELTLGATVQDVPDVLARMLQGLTP